MIVACKTMTADHLATTGLEPPAASGRLRHVRDLLLILGLAVFSSLAALASLPGADLDRPQALAVIFPPWMSGDEAILRSVASGARILRSGRWPFVVVVAPAQGGTTVDAVTRPAGAFLVVRLDGLFGCADDRAGSVE